MARGFEEPLGSRDRPRRVDAMREGRDEQPDDFVADELVDDGVVIDEDPRRRVVETIEQAAD